MQVRTVTSSFIFSNDCTLEMLTELALHKDFLAMSQDAVDKLASQQLKQASQGSGVRSNGVGNLPNAKLRTVIVNKLQDSPTVGQVFKDGTMQFEFTCLPDEVAPKKSVVRKASTELTGNYVVVKQGVKCNATNDPEKYKIWEHVWNSKSFEEYFAKAPKKGLTKTGRVITAASEMRWAVKCGWIKPVAAQQ